MELICAGSVLCLFSEELERFRVGGTGGLILGVLESSEKVLELGVGTVDTPEVVLEADMPRTGAGRLGGGGGGFTFDS